VRREVDRREASELDAATFLLAYLMPNRPLLLTAATAGWRAAAEWVQPDGAPNMDFLARRFGDSVCCVADCAAAEDAPRLTMALSQYAAYWRAHACGEDARTLYLKDWHAAAEHPDYKAYTTPPQFAGDALNAYYDARRASSAVEASDYRFVYVGPAGSSTPLHSDVLHSYSWSASVSGTKEWLLFPPHQTHLLRDARGGLPADAAAERCAPSGAFPRIGEATPVRLTQLPGEALFVPSGWHHQVVNATDALSINHNWTHPAGLHWLLGFVLDDAAGAAAAISDLAPLLPAAEFAALVQRNTAANAGMDFAQLACCAWLAAAQPMARLRPGCDGSDRERAAAALACARCACVLRALAAQPAHSLVHHAEDGGAPVAPAAWADELEAALAAAGFVGGV
jgi:hypothetical protein